MRLTSRVFSSSSLLPHALLDEADLAAERQHRSSDVGQHRSSDGGQHRSSDGGDATEETRRKRVFETERDCEEESVGVMRGRRDSKLLV